MGSINSIGGSPPPPPPGRRSPDEEGKEGEDDVQQPRSSPAGTRDELVLSAGVDTAMEMKRKELAQLLEQQPDLLQKYLETAPTILATLLPFLSEDLRKRVQAQLEGKTK